MTAWLEYGYRVPKKRWWVRAPETEESIESILERASHVYGGVVLEREGWVADALGSKCAKGAPLQTLDIARLASLLSVRPVDMHRARVLDTPDVLAPGQRRAYCAACWLEDDAMGRPRHFRRAWARVLALSCQRHNEPLEWATHPLFTLNRIPVQRHRLAGCDAARWLLSMVDAFAQVLDGYLFRGQAWPSSWRITGYEARALLCHCLGHLESELGRSVGQSLWPGPGPQSMYRARKEDTPPWRGSPWEAVRHSGRPSWRRGALWITASRTLEWFPEELAPPGIAEALRASTHDALQRGHTRSPGKRILRLRAALMRDRKGWMREDP